MKQQIIKQLSKHLSLSKQQIENLIETPPSQDLGDYAFPCFSLAKELKKNPNQIALEISQKLNSKDFEKIEAKGPYINFFIDRNKLSEETIKKILKEKEKYGSVKKSNNTTMIEFSQANTHKAFHIGHVRGTSFGESLSRILEFSGNKVIRANYQGDTGMHVAKWLWCYQKFHKKESLKNDESWIASIYVDAVKRLTDNEEFQEEVNEINRKLDSNKDKKLNDLWKETRKISLESFKKIYSQLNTRFDRFYFESEVEKKAKSISDEILRKKIAILSEGAVIMDLKEFNLSVWVLLRSDGTVLYSAKDLALAESKFKEYKLDKSIVITDASQDLHFKQLEKTLNLMNFPKSDSYSHISYNQVRFPWGKMSSRTGENILYSEFIKELQETAAEEIKKREKLSQKELDERSLAIAIAALKYQMLKQDPNKNLIFDKEEAIKFEGNTGPYLLYTYARAKSILKKIKKVQKLKISELNEQEKSLILELSKFPEEVQHAFENLSPNLIANYVYSLSQKFNEFYHTNQVVGSENESFRIALVEATSIVIKNSLNLLGIQTLERM